MTTIQLTCSKCQIGIIQIENNYNPIRKINFGLTKCYKVVFFHYQLN